MRLIDADTIPYDVLSVGGAITSLKQINQLPTIDAVPVIRCAACSWRKKGDFCRRHGHYVRADFFCAYGTTEIQQKPAPKKKAETPPETKPEAYCGSTGRPCSMCVPGPCDHRRM